MTRRDRYRGCLLGLAAGDAVGATVEFQPPGTFDPVTDMHGGGPHGLEAGQWTDDTSMALCLAESLLECAGFDARDQIERYVRWWQDGHLSSTGACFDIGLTVRSALNAFLRSGEPMAGPTAENTAGNGSIMRLAPVPMYYAGDPAEAMRLAGESSRTTHGTQACIDACRYMTGLIVGALGGASKQELLGERYSPVPGYWDGHPLVEEIDEIARGSFKDKQPPEIQGSGYVVRSLEAALWALHHGRNFREGCLLAVNLGDDADTTGAVYGQLAGALYGVMAIPKHWRQQLTRVAMIDDFAIRLAEAADRGRPPRRGRVRRSEEPLPGLEDIKVVVAFLPIFGSPGFTWGQFEGGERRSDGAVTMPYFALSEAAGRFHRVLYERGFVRRFDWPRWQDQAARYVEDPAAVEDADLETLCRLLTTHLRKDRFCDGHMAEMHRRGHLLAILRRLTDLMPG